MKRNNLPVPPPPQPRPPRAIIFLVRLAAAACFGVAIYCYNEWKIPSTTLLPSKADAGGEAFVLLHFYFTLVLNNYANRLKKS